MITLYNVPVSSYGSKIRIILHHKGIEWTEIAPPDGYGSTAYKAIIPAGTVPAIDDDGLLLSDSEAIAEYLDETYPTPSMMPASPLARAKAREISRFHDTRIEPVLRSYFGQVASTSRNAEIITGNAKLLQTRLDDLAIIASPAPFMSGDTLGIADTGFSASFAILALLCDILDLPVHLPDALADYEATLINHPSVAEENLRYRSVLASWAKTKIAS